MQYSIKSDAKKDEDKIVLAVETQTVVKEQTFSLAQLREQVNNLITQIAKLQAEKTAKEALIADIKLSLGLKEETKL